MAGARASSIGSPRAGRIDDERRGRGHVGAGDDYRARPRVLGAPVEWRDASPARPDTRDASPPPPRPPRPMARYRGAPRSSRPASSPPPRRRPSRPRPPPEPRSTRRPRSARRGMAKFVQNDVEGSIADFDLVVQNAPRMEPYMWQRGLSLYYAERYEDGAAQFRKDVAVNPNDTEEAIWAFLCDARDPNVGFSTSPFDARGTGPEAVHASRVRPVQRRRRRIGRRARGRRVARPRRRVLLAPVPGALEGGGEATKPARGICSSTAAQTQYANRSGDYMAALALVHCKRRGWAT